MNEKHGLSNFFEKLEHHTKAQKALQKGKEIEAKKISNGAVYVRVDAKTWKLEGGTV